MISQKIIRTGSYVEKALYRLTNAQVAYYRSGTRAPKTNKTSEKQRRQNIKNSKKQLNRLVKANFTPGIDLFATLTFAEMPELEDVQREVRSFIARLRPLYKFEGVPLKYIYVIERGRKGRLHVHILLSNCTRSKISEAWTAGKCTVERIKKNGDPAEYLSKAPVGSQRFVCSKNLIRPAAPERSEISEKEFKRVLAAVILNNRDAQRDICGGNTPAEAYTYFTSPFSSECRGVYLSYIEHRSGTGTKYKRDRAASLAVSRAAP